MKGRRKILSTGIRLLTAGLLPLYASITRVFAADDPRPEFAASTVEQVLGYYFGTTDAADDASIKIILPIASEHKHLIPFKIIAPSADKIAVVTDANSEPLILAMDQIKQSPSVIVGRARIERSGMLSCYVMRNGALGRSSRRVTISGYWQEQT